MCCPSRATILTGKYTHNHRIISNALPYGGAKLFREKGLDQDTLATRLDKAGYETAYFGKYLNSYSGTYVPPGWGRWFTFAGDLSERDAYQVNDDGELSKYQRDWHNDTDLVADKAATFVESHQGSPWFAVVGTHAPHGPYHPPGRHRHDFDGVSLPKPPSFDERDVSDKPKAVRERPRLSGGAVADLRDEYEGKLETLQGVDDLVGRLVGELKRTGQLDRTYVVYLTDNGMQMGEHRILSVKGKPYEESIRTPLFVRGPGVPAGATRDQLVSNVDLAPTIATWAGSDTSGYDGRSLEPLLADNPPQEWRDILLIEHFAGTPWAGVRTQKYAYVEHQTGEKELYDLVADPYELHNLFKPDQPDLPSPDPALVARLQDRLEELSDCSGDGCRSAEQSQ